MSNEQFPGLDYDFLRYIGVKTENQRIIQSHYIPYFQNMDRVVDLGCGDADFVAVMQEQTDVDIIGVDFDDKAYQAAKDQGLPVIKADIFDWLEKQEDESYDGVFSAHLVEHIPYQKVLAMVQQAYRILKPGGVVVLATPNVRALVSHLEMFYLHYGHETFYHPRLLSFFLDYAGFTQITQGENPLTHAPILGDLYEQIRKDSVLNYTLNVDSLPLSVTKPIRQMHGLASTEEFTQQFPHEDIRSPSNIPIQGDSFLHRLSYELKHRLADWLVRPLLDETVRSVQETMNRRESRLEQELCRLEETLLPGVLEERSRWHIDRIQELENQVIALQKQVNQIGVSFERIDGTFEAYVVGYKPMDEKASKE